MRHDGGKGDKPRPIPDRKKFEDNWDAIFKKPYERLQDGEGQKVVPKEVADEIDKALSIKR